MRLNHGANTLHNSQAGSQQALEREGTLTLCGQKGYLTYEKTPPPSTLLKAYAGSGVDSGFAFSDGRGTPVRKPTHSDQGARCTRVGNCTLIIQALIPLDAETCPDSAETRKYQQQNIMPLPPFLKLRTHCSL